MIELNKKQSALLLSLISIVPLLITYLFAYALHILKIINLVIIISPVGLPLSLLVLSIYDIIKYPNKKLRILSLVICVATILIQMYPIFQATRMFFEK